MADPSQPDAAPLEERGPDAIPADNLPGHHPEVEQDKPSGDAFVARAKKQTKKKSAAPTKKRAPAAKKQAAPARKAQAADEQSAAPGPVAPGPEVVGGGSDGDVVAPEPPAAAPAPAPAPVEPAAPPASDDLLSKVGDLVGQARRAGESLVERLRRR